MKYQISAQSHPSGSVDIKRRKTGMYKQPQLAKSKRKKPSPLKPIPSGLYINNSTQQPLRPGHGLPCPQSKFSFRASKTIREHCLALEQFDKANTFLIVLTLPGSTGKARCAMEDYCGDAVNRFSNFIRSNIPGALYVRVWEYQNRKALHLNYSIHVPPECQHRFNQQIIQREWFTILSSISKKSGVDLFEQRTGGTWANRPSKLVVYCGRCRESLAHYLSKKKTKDPRKRRDGTLVSPGRWYEVSQPLRTFVRDNYASEVIEVQSERQQRLVEDLLIQQLAPNLKPKDITNPFTGEGVGSRVTAFNKQHANHVIRTIANHYRT